MARKQNVGATASAESGDRVMVCLNRPTGIRFRLRDGRSVTVAGNAADLRGLDMGVLPLGGYGMTSVRREDWEEILAVYGPTMEIFGRGLIFAAGDAASAADEAEDRKELRGGLEPVNPENCLTRRARPEGA